MSKSKKVTEEQYIEALYEMDRSNYSGRFVQGFVHNANGPLQNLTMLAEMVASGIDLQERLFQAGDKEQWSALMEKQRRRLTQIREQIARLSADLREFMQLYEIEKLGTEVDINAILERMVKLFRADLFFKHHVHCELDLAKNLPHIKVPGKDIVPAVFHLFQNGVRALKTSEKKSLRVESFLQNEEITVKITDSGAELPEGAASEDLFDLFESRWQLPDKTGAVPADRHLGFGLYAARQLLLPHGFEVHLEKSGQETSALIRMPLNPKPAENSAGGKTLQ
ncbi:MAG: sensor histidine kinase [Syntrophobacteraceae bacterium]